MAGQRPIEASRINWQHGAIMTTTQGVTQQVAHSMTTQGTIPFWNFSPPVGLFRGGAPSHGKVNVMYNNISQILQLYKVLGYYDKFDSLKSLGVYYWYVKMARCGYVGHGLEYLSFYVQKHIVHMVACSAPPAGSRRAARGARISETRLL